MNNLFHTVVVNCCNCHFVFVSPLSSYCMFCCVCVFCVCIYVCLILAELYDDLPIKAFECEILNMNPCLWCYSTCIAIHLFTVILSLFAVKWLHLGSFFYPFHWFKFFQRPQLSIACTGSPILILVIFTKTAQYFLVSQKLQYTWINIHKKIFV